MTSEVAQSAITLKSARISTVAVLSLVCCEPRCRESGLSVSADQFSVARQVARLAFREIVGRAECLDEVDYRTKRLSDIWISFLETLSERLDATVAASIINWIDEFQAYLCSGDSQNLAVSLLLLNSNPLHMRERFASDVQNALRNKSSKILIPMVSRHKVAPVDAFDRLVYAVWKDAGNPALSLDQFIAYRAAKQIVLEVSEKVDPQSKEQLMRLIANPPVRVV